MNPLDEFNREVKANIKKLGKDASLREISTNWIRDTARYKYSYNFRWMGRPVIQFPQDMIAMQELIWTVRPDLIIETGIAHGGSLVFYASMLALLDLCERSEKETGSPERRVLGIDIDIREHNRQAITSHPMASYIQIIEGSSVAHDTVEKVRNIAGGHERIMVALDSNHTHEHVLEELRQYAELTSPGSYCVVFDTVIEDMPADMFPDRPWGPGNNPGTAVGEFLRANDNFEIDREISDKLLITVAPHGYLRRVA